MQVARDARVSTSQQEKNDTIESQLESLKASVQSPGYTLFPAHIFIDNGISGSRLDRPALDRLRDQVRLGACEAVVILSPDRFARSDPQQWLLQEEWQKYGCAVIFGDNPCGDSPHGHLLTQMPGMMAEYERSHMVERTRRGRLSKARKGECMPWAHLIYGYRSIPKHSGLPPQVEIHPEQAIVVQEICRWLLQEQQTTRQIVKRLNALQIPTRTRKHRVWHASSVRNILINPMYTGHGYDNKTKTGVPRQEPPRKYPGRKEPSAREQRPREDWMPITAPAIISPQTFEKAQEPRQRNQEKARRSSQPTSRRSLLRTLVRCGQCQLRMHATRQTSVCKRYEYLYDPCAGKDALTVGRVEYCSARHVRADRLDALVWDLVQELLQQPQVLLKEYALWQQVQQGQQAYFQDQWDRIQWQWRNRERQLQRLIDAYQQEGITLQELSARRAQVEQRLKGLKQERTSLEYQRDTAIKWEHLVTTIEHFRTLLGKNVARLPFEERQAVVQLLVEKVVVHQDGAVEVHHILPFAEKPVAADPKKKVSAEGFSVLRLQHLDGLALVIQGVDFGY